MRLTHWQNTQKLRKSRLKTHETAWPGAIRNLDPKVTAKRNLDIIFYNVNYIDDAVYSQRESIEFLQRNKFRTEMLYVSSDIEEIINKIDTVDRDQLDFLIDGMVIKVDDFARARKARLYRQISALGHRV